MGSSAPLPQRGHSNHKKRPWRLREFFARRCARFPHATATAPLISPRPLIFRSRVVADRTSAFRLQHHVSSWCEVLGSSSRSNVDTCNARCLVKIHFPLHPRFLCTNFRVKVCVGPAHASLSVPLIQVRPPGHFTHIIPITTPIVSALKNYYT